MAYEGTIEAITPFSEELILPEGEHLINAQMLSQLMRYLNHLEDELGTDSLSTITSENQLTNFSHVGYYPDDIDLSEVTGDNLESAINYTVNSILLPINNKVRGMCLSQGFGNEYSQIKGYDSSSDRLWRYHVYDASGVPFLTTYIEKLQEYDIYSVSTFNLDTTKAKEKANWYGVIDTLQTVMNLFEEKKSDDYIAVAGRVHIDAIDRKYNGQNFAFNQLSGKETRTSTYVAFNTTITDGTGYNFTGVTGYNFCSELDTVFDDMEFQEFLSKWESNNSPFGEGYIYLLSAGYDYADYSWIIPGGGGALSTKSATTFYYDTTAGYPICTAKNTLVATSGELFPPSVTVYGKYAGFYGSFASTSTYEIYLTIDGLTTWTIEGEPIEIIVEPAFIKTGEYFFYTSETTDNLLDVFNNSSSVEMTLQCDVVSHGLNQPVYSPDIAYQSIGGTLRLGGGTSSNFWNILVNGSPITSGTGILLYKSPSNKIYT